MKDNFVFTLSLVLVTFGSIAYFTVNQIKSEKKLKEISNEYSNYEPIPTIDLNDPKAKEILRQRIKHYESIERNPVMHLSSLEETERIRKLEDFNSFDDVGIVDSYETPFFALGRWISRSIKLHSPEIVVYPYAFDYYFDDNETNKVKHFQQGAYISLNPANLEPYEIGLKTNSTVSVKKARAVFDQDIAILGIEYKLGSFPQDLFQDAVDWCTYFQTNLDKGTCYPSYDQFLSAKKRNSTKSYVSKVNETDIISGTLIKEDGFPRFGILIIPDFKLGVESVIKTLLTNNGIENIKKYYNAGGIIIATGKSGALLEDFGLVAEGSYDRTKLFSSDTSSREIKIKGCENAKEHHYDSSVDDFNKQLLCISITEYTRPCLSTTFKMNQKDTTFQTILSIDPSFGDLVYTDINSGIPENLTDADKSFTPLVMRKSNSKGGQIFLLNFNPVYSGSYKNIVLNVLVLASSKEMYVTSKVNMDINSVDAPYLPIPAGEAGINLEINSLFHNLNDKAISELKMYIFLPENFGWSNQIPSFCEKRKDESIIPNNVKKMKTFYSSNEYLYCNKETLSAYEKLYIKTSISILNYKATQEKYDILILEPIVTYIDSNKKENLLVDFVRATAEAAPVLRVAINPDPSSFYPYYGRGQYVDNIVKIENKEETSAYDVEYIGLIPLVSPLTDGVDQRVLCWNLQIYVDYYNSNNFEVPFKSSGAEDYIYTGQLLNKGVTIAAEWDSPVLPVKEILSGKGENGKEADIPGISLGTITVTSTSEVIKQVNYRKSDRFYKLASQRLMAFIDTSKPEGMKTLYGSYEKIPDEWKDPILKDRAKKDFIFSRSDIYFYENENYCNPPGIKEQHVFSLDSYKSYQKGAKGCAEKRGQASSKVLVPGYFNNFDEDKRDTILRPAEWSNEMFEYCDLTVIDPTSSDEISKVFGNTDNLRPVHYLVPNVESSITRPCQIFGFKEEDNYHGYLEKYPSVKFIYVHSLTYVIPTSYCLYGGLIEINLGEYNIKGIEDVTISPDQIAFYKTTYENHIIKAYFKRGLMSNEQFGKNMTITINIENLNSQKAEKFKVSLYQVKYDISFPPEYERYYKYGDETKEFNYVSVFSYPALELKTKLNRTLDGYETIEPFSRYGVYIQELIAHRETYAYTETHHERVPGLTGSSPTFSLISNLGISSIPFLEYVTAGTGQVIPAGTSTSRASWKDIWGRTWNQPLRSVFPDVPPIPPPLKNFVMTTTYEILRNGNRITEWPSDENAKIHLHVKLLNNYPKHFEITRCKENQIRFVPTVIAEEHSREYELTSQEDLSNSELNGEKMFLSKGGYASYGKCFMDNKAIVSGKSMNDDFKKELEQAVLCADFRDGGKIEECEKKLENIITVKKMPGTWNSTKTWNYSPLVENYYPEGYIEDDMWQLTHLDYDDNPMDKAYKYHVDNLIPNLDNDIIKPHNTIAIPIYKGLGYDISYDKNNSMNYHGETKKGWWSDNLQNKDDTLLAGQKTCNKISVNKKSSITEWVEYKDLVGSKREGSEESIKKITDQRIKNIYVCLYNRKRPVHNPENGRNYWAKNINQNNIVPIIVNLSKDDKRLTNYECKENQYTPENIHEMTENYLSTPTGKDYLYFAANLRGQAKESFNILMNLNYFSKIKYEGMVKVNEGGRFLYWNPVNGPNSFVVVDDPVTIINSKRNDLQIKNEIFPLRTTTFNSVVYQLYSFFDENKINKEWPFSGYYTNSYGFGDVSVSVYVGGIRKSKAVLEPGSTTYTKIVFNNNCGFDWNMLIGAIDFEYIETKPINAHDLLYTLKHSIQKPLKYNFFNYSIEEAYADYITIEPSDHNVGVAPEFFDFENINVVTIRDGFKGEYYLKIKVKDTFPDNLRGKPIEIKIGINTTLFDHFPGSNSDPIKSYHDYTVEIPPVYIAVPFKSGEFAGKVFYTSAQATNLDMKFNIDVDWKIDEIKYIDEETIEKIRDGSNEKDFNKILLNIFTSLPGNSTKFTEEKISTDIKTVSITGISEDFPKFPKKNLGAPDTAKINFIVKSTVSQLQYGYSYPITNIRMPYKDWIKKTKIAYGDGPQLYAEGAWLELSYSRTLVDEVSPGVYVDSLNQQLALTDEGIMKVQFKLQNIGNGISYNTLYQIVIQPNLTFIKDVSGKHSISSSKNELGQTILSFDYGTPINAGELKGGIIYLKYKKYLDTYDGLTEEDLSKLPSQLKVVQESSARIDLTNTTGEIQVTQHLRKSLVFDYNKQDKTFVYTHLIITGRRNDPTIEVVPVVKYSDNESEDDILATIGKIDLTKYIEDNEKELRLLDEIEEEKKYTYTYLYQKEGLKNKEDKPIQKAKSQKNHIVLYSVSIYSKKNKITSSSVIKYEQNKIGLSIYESIFIIVSIVLLCFSMLLIYKGIKNLMYAKNNYSIESEIKQIETQMDQLIEE